MGMEIFGSRRETAEDFSTRVFILESQLFGLRGGWFAFEKPFLIF